MKKFTCFFERRSIVVQAKDKTAAQRIAGDKFGVRPGKCWLIRVMSSNYDDGTRYTPAYGAFV